MIAVDAAVEALTEIVNRASQLRREFATDRECRQRRDLEQLVVIFVGALEQRIRSGEEFPGQDGVFDALSAYRQWYRDRFRPGLPDMPLGCPRCGVRWYPTTAEDRGDERKLVGTCPRHGMYVDRWKDGATAHDELRRSRA